MAENVCPKCGAATWKVIDRKALSLPPYHYFNCGSTTQDRSDECRIHELERKLAAAEAGAVEIRNALRVIAGPHVFEPGYATPLDVVRGIEKLATTILERLP